MNSSVWTVSAAEGEKIEDFFLNLFWAQNRLPLRLYRREGLKKATVYRTGGSDQPVLF